MLGTSAPTDRGGVVMRPGARRYGGRFLIPAVAVLAFMAPPTLPAQDARPLQEKDALEVLATVCAGKVRSHALKHGESYGCGGCPSFTSFTGQPASQGDEPDFELRSLLKGAFTRPGANQTLAEFFGCEPHASNFGGTLLLEGSGSKLGASITFKGSSELFEVIL
jgi:hypothetical protein